MAREFIPKCLFDEASSRSQRLKPPGDLDLNRFHFPAKWKEKHKSRLIQVSCLEYGWTNSKYNSASLILIEVLCLFQLNIGQVMWRMLKYTCSSLNWIWRRLSDICIFNILWKALASLTIIYTKKFLQESVDHPSAIQPPEAESIWTLRTWWKLIIFTKYFYVNEIQVFKI